MNPLHSRYDPGHASANTDRLDRALHCAAWPWTSFKRRSVVPRATTCTGGDAATATATAKPTNSVRSSPHVGTLDAPRSPPSRCRRDQTIRIALGVAVVAGLCAVALVLLAGVVLIALWLAAAVYGPVPPVAPDVDSPRASYAAGGASARNLNGIPVQGANEGMDSGPLNALVPRPPFGESAVASASSAARDMQVYDGVIDEVGNGQIVLTVGGEAMLFRIEPGAAVTLDGRPAGVGDLKPGQWAAVTAIALEDAVMIATDIRAESEVASHRVKA